LKINVGGLEAGVYVLWRLKASAAGLSAAPKKKISQAGKRGNVPLSEKIN
jgi:hypothetical protein